MTYRKELIDEIQNHATFFTFFVGLLFEGVHFLIGWSN